MRLDECYEYEYCNDIGEMEFLCICMGEVAIWTIWLQRVTLWLAVIRHDMAG